MSHRNSKTIALQLGAALAGSLILSGSAFAMQPLAQGYLLGAATDEPAEPRAASTGKSAEGCCGTAAKIAEGKCGEGQCGGAKCGDPEPATAQPAPVDRDGNVDKQGSEGKCGEGKCGEGKCGGGG